MNTQKQPWYNNSILANILLLLFLPFGLYALWKSDKIAKWWKVTASSIIAIIFLSTLGDNDEKADSDTNIYALYQKKLDDIGAIDEVDSARSSLINQLNKNQYYKKLVTDSITIENLRTLNMLNEVYANLEVRYNDETADIDVNTTVTELNDQLINSNEEMYQFFNINHGLLKHGGYSKEVLMKFIEYADEYGYFGPPSVKYDVNGNKINIDFAYSLIQTIIPLAPANRELLDKFCSAYKLGYATLDKGQSYENMWFRNIDSYNKYLKIEYPDCDCYEDYEEMYDDFKSNCINEFYGRCTDLMLYTKDRLKDPESFEHISTSAYQKKKYTIVTMKFRAKNSYGGYSISVIKAKMNEDCEVIEVLSWE